MSKVLVTGGAGYSVRQVVDTAVCVLGRPIPTIEEGRRTGDPAVLVASIEKAEELLNWRPTRDLEKMMSDAYASLR